jgi:hypothetical protein
MEPSVYLWRVNCSDTFNNVNVSQTRRLTIDTDKPMITLINLSDNINVTYTNVTFNWTVSDNLSPTVLCNITVNSVNVTTFVNVSNNQMRNYTVNLSEGVKTWNITCTDLAGNSNMSATRSFAILYDVDNFTAVMASDNTSVILMWSNASAADYYEIYISTNGTFADVPNSTGLRQLNYTDDNASQSATRFYKIAGVRSDSTKVTVRTTGKQTITIPAGWSMVSWPISPLYNFTLKNETSPGYDLITTPVRCVQEIWKYNVSRPGSAWELTVYDNDVWTQGTGGGNFTVLQGGMGYWLYNNASQDCNLTFAGVVPSDNTTLRLNNGLNLVGWYSESSPAFPTDCQDPYPFAVSPRNSITTVYYYNTTTETFKGSLHLTSGSCGASNDWGWWPEDYFPATLTPGTSYYIKTNQTATWTIQSTR